MAVKTTNEIELTFEFSNGSTETKKFGNYGATDSYLTNLKTNIESWNNNYCPTNLIVNDKGLVCNKISGASIITTVETDIL